MGNGKKEKYILTPFERALYKENNLFQKHLFRKYLFDSILHGNEKDFSKIVEFIGIQWGVRRTVSNKIDDEIKESESTNEIQSVVHNGFDGFTKHLWNAKDKILSGQYYEGTKKENDFHAHSYVSKICFLLNPEKYRIIYDSHNTNSVNELLNKNKKSSFSFENWKEVVNDENYNKILDGLKSEEILEKDFNPISIEDYFLVDCELWLKGF